MKASGWLVVTLALCAMSELAPRLSAQSPPPVQGTVAPDSTTRSVYAGAAALVEGVERVARYTKNLFTRGGNPGVDPLNGLREGTTVAVRRGVPPPGVDDLESTGANVTEGVVTRIERGRKQVVIRLDDHTTETLRIANYAVSDARAAADPPDETMVTVYYRDETGERAAHPFKKVR
jgi:hypothetical protein